MEIPRSIIDLFNNEINTFSAAVQANIRRCIYQLIEEVGTNDVALLRTICIELINYVVSGAIDVVLADTAIFYDYLRELQGVQSAYSAKASVGGYYVKSDEVVRAFVQQIVDGDDDAFTDSCAGWLDRQMRRSVNECLTYNASADPAKPRYALVPSGAETCSFCLMLASFGYHYKNEQINMHTHSNCDCRVVPNFDVARNSVEGYDADRLYEQYTKIQNMLGGRDALVSEWENLEAAAKQAYIDNHSGKEYLAKQAYINRKISNAIDAVGADAYVNGDF